MYVRPKLTFVSFFYVFFFNLPLRGRVAMCMCGRCAHNICVMCIYAQSLHFMLLICTVANPVALHVLISHLNFDLLILQSPWRNKFCKQFVAK